MVQRVFVYGTLGPGGPNEHVLNAIGGTWEEASVKGYLKPQGWGTEMGYPGMVLADTGDEIKGHIFCSSELNYHWDELDEFEGEEYQRVLIKVKTKAQMTVEAYIYVLRESSSVLLNQTKSVK